METNELISYSRLVYSITLKTFLASKPDAHYLHGDHNRINAVAEKIILVNVTQELPSENE